MINNHINKPRAIPIGPYPLIRAATRAAATMVVVLGVVDVL